MWTSKAFFSVWSIKCLVQWRFVNKDHCLKFIVNLCQLQKTILQYDIWYTNFSFIRRQGHHNSSIRQFSGPCSEMRQTLRVVTVRDLFMSSVFFLRPPYNIVRVKADSTSGFMSLSEKTRHWESKVSCPRTHRDSPVWESNPDHWTRRQCPNH